MVYFNASLTVVDEMSVACLGETVVWGMCVQNRLNE
jgi:hypothetical protein